MHITVMCDVDNPLYGSTGAAYIFAPQKGADENMVTLLDEGLKKMDIAIQASLNRSVAELPGCVAFLGAELKSGIECVLDTVGFDAILRGADLVITGEGRIDSQSVHGKVISGIAKRTKPLHIPLVALVGSIAEDAAAGYDLGVTAMFSIDRSAQSFQEYASKTNVYYQRTLEDILRLLKAANR